MSFTPAADLLAELAEQRAAAKAAAAQQVQHRIAKIQPGVADKIRKAVAAGCDEVEVLRISRYAYDVASERAVAGGLADLLRGAGYEVEANWSGEFALTVRLPA